VQQKDAETGQGLVTDVCIKRKMRNYVETTRGSQPGHAIHVREKAILNVHQEPAYKTLELDTAKDDQASADAGRAWMCKTYYDVRTFGAVMTTGTKGLRANCGQVRGPVQLTFGRSIDPIVVGKRVQPPGSYRKNPSAKNDRGIARRRSTFCRR
jgi:CRISPR-associated protein Csd2